MKVVFGAILIVLTMTGCATKNMNILRSNVPAIGADSVKYLETFIQNGDLLFIGVTSKDPQSDIRYNLNNYYSSGAQTSPTSTSVLGYLVDQEGKIKIADAGEIIAQGSTPSQLAVIIQGRLELFLKDPIVTVRYLNFRVTVLGEVARPGTFQISTGNVTLIEALGIAGDLTIYGQRENVMVVRENNGQREYGYVDLTNGNVFQSKYYRLRQNDVIYISMNKRKVINSDQTLVRNISLGTGILSTIAIIISALK